MKGCDARGLQVSQERRHHAPPFQPRRRGGAGTPTASQPRARSFPYEASRPRRCSARHGMVGRSKPRKLSLLAARDRFGRLRDANPRACLRRAPSAQEVASSGERGPLIAYCGGQRIRQREGLPSRALWRPTGHCTTSPRNCVRHRQDRARARRRQLFGQEIRRPCPAWSAGRSERRDRPPQTPRKADFTRFVSVVGGAIVEASTRTGEQMSRRDGGVGVPSSC